MEFGEKFLNLVEKKIERKNREKRATSEEFEEKKEKEKGTGEIEE
jgi:hypothetical protein